MSDETCSVSIPIPLPEDQVFRYEAIDDIIEILYKNPHDSFMVTELRKITGHGGKSVDNAIKILEKLDLIQKRREGHKSLISINQDTINKPEDRILRIKQGEYRKPAKKFLERTEDNENIVAVILFGSVARGEADRSSDIDIQVIVEDNLVESRRELQEIRSQLEDQKFDGQRYKFHLLVESIETAEEHGEKLQEIFSEGINLYTTEKFEEIKKAVFNG